MERSTAQGRMPGTIEDARTEEEVREGAEKNESTVRQ